MRDLYLKISCLIETIFMILKYGLEGAEKKARHDVEIQELIYKTLKEVGYK